MKKRPVISYGRQTITDSDIAAVAKVLRSDFLTQGANVSKFEKALARKTGAKYAVAVSSGTAALHIAYLALGLKEGDEVVTSPLTFAATANAALYAGAKPVFADIDPETALIDPAEIRRAVTSETKIIAPVHYAGLPCDMKAIREIADEAGAYVVEDACHALGAACGDEITGSCAHSHMTVFSFHPVKHITTGEGGAVTTNDESLYKKLLLLRSHGINKNEFLNPPDSPSYAEMQLLGFNYRLTDFQAALGESQLKKLGRFLKKRRKIAAYYTEKFECCEAISLQKIPREYAHAYHLFPITLRSGELRDAVFEHLARNGIKAQIHYMPVNAHPWYGNTGYKKTDTPRAYDYYRRELSLPIYPLLKKDELKYVASQVLKATEKNP